MYSPLVRPGGLVAFHDISYRRISDFDDSMACGRVYDEIQGYRKEEIILTHGIGIIWT